MIKVQCPFYIQSLGTAAGKSGGLREGKILEIARAEGENDGTADAVGSQQRTAGAFKTVEVDGGNGRALRAGGAQQS